MLVLLEYGLTQLGTVRAGTPLGAACELHGNDERLGGNYLFILLLSQVFCQSLANSTADIIYILFIQRNGLLSAAGLQDVLDFSGDNSNNK